MARKETMAERKYCKTQADGRVDRFNKKYGLK